jgi:hypothetical protein
MKDTVHGDNRMELQKLTQTLNKTKNITYELSNFL